MHFVQPLGALSPRKWSPGARRSMTVPRASAHLDGDSPDGSYALQRRLVGPQSTIGSYSASHGIRQPQHGLGLRTPGIAEARGRTTSVHPVNDCHGVARVLPRSATLDYQLLNIPVTKVTQKPHETDLPCALPADGIQTPVDVPCGKERGHADPPQHGELAGQARAVEVEGSAALHLSAQFFALKVRHDYASDNVGSNTPILDGLIHEGNQDGWILARVASCLPLGDSSPWGRPSMRAG